jgi:hypothetical protein
MNKGYNIKIVHENMGTLLNETFSNGDQFKLFLRLMDGCMAHKSDFLSHIPFRILKDSVIMTNVTEVSMTELVKSKIEALVTK